MAATVNNLATKERICNAALALLRQDVAYSEPIGGGDATIVSKSIDSKCANVWNLAMENLRSAHNWYAWGNPDGGIPSSLAYRQLLVYSLARELAIPVTGRQEDLKTVDSLYTAKLRQGIAKDLEEENAALRTRAQTADASVSSDAPFADISQDDAAFASEALDILRQYYSVADGDRGNGRPAPQPRGVRILVDHIQSVKARIRTEVLTTHPWSFATDDARVRSSVRDDGKWHAAIPGNAVQVVKCYSDDCDKAETFIRNGDELVTRTPIGRVVYLFDEGGTDNWSEAAKRAYLYRVVLAVAYANPELVGNPARLRQLEQLAESEMQTARTTDARQTHLGTSAYGRNYLYDVAVGRRRAKWLGCVGRRPF